MREGRSLRVSPWVGVGDGEAIADTGCAKLKFTPQCMRKGLAVGGSPWDNKGVDPVVVGAGCGELERSHQAICPSGTTAAFGFHQITNHITIYLFAKPHPSDYRNTHPQLNSDK